MKANIIQYDGSGCVLGSNADEGDAHFRMGIEAMLLAGHTVRDVLIRFGEVVHESYREADLVARQKSWEAVCAGGKSEAPAELVARCVLGFSKPDEEAADGPRV